MTKIIVHTESDVEVAGSSTALHNVSILHERSNYGFGSGSGDAMGWRGDSAVRSMPIKVGLPHVGSLHRNASGVELVVKPSLIGPTDASPPSSSSEASPADSPTSVITSPEEPSSSEKLGIIQIRSIQRTGSEIRVSYYLGDPALADMAIPGLPVPSRTVSVPPGLGRSGSLREGKQLQRTTSAQALSMRLGFETEQAAVLAECMLVEDTSPCAPCAPVTHGVETKSAVAEAQSTGRTDPYGTAALTTVSNSVSPPKQPLVRAEAMQMLNRTPSQREHGHNIAFGRERAVICTLATCVILLVSAAVAVPVLLCVGGVAFFRYKLVSYLEDAFARAFEAARAKKAPQADANLLRGVLRNIQAFDASLDTEHGSLTDASEDTEMWRGTHDGSQDGITTPRGAGGAKDLVLSSNNNMLEGPLTSRISRRAPFVDSSVQAGAHPALLGHHPERRSMLKKNSLGVEDSDSSQVSMVAPGTPPVSDDHTAEHSDGSETQRVSSYSGCGKPIVPFHQKLHGTPELFIEYWTKNHLFTEDEVRRYIAGHASKTGDLTNAHKAIAVTAAFKRDHEAYNILEQKQLYYLQFKQFFTHGTVGKAKDGSPVWQIKVGEVEEGYRQYKASTRNKRDVDRHIAFCHDFLYKVLDTRPLPHGKSYWILDLKGLSPVSLASPAVLFGIELMTVIEKHYPERLTTAFVVNTPYFFALFWKIVKPLMPAATKKRLNIMQDQKQYLAALREAMDDEVIPIEYGGLNKMGTCYQSPEEVALLDLAVANNKGTPMEGVKPVDDYAQAEA